MVPRLTSSVTTAATLFIVNFIIIHMLTKLHHEHHNPLSLDNPSTPALQERAEHRHNSRGLERVPRVVIEESPMNNEHENKDLAMNIILISDEYMDTSKSVNGEDNKNQENNIESKVPILDSLRVRVEPNVTKNSVLVDSDLEVSYTCNIPLPRKNFQNMSSINGWQEFKLGSSKSIYLHRAHYDDREYIKDTPSIRIYAVVPFRQLKTPIYCYLWYDYSFDGNAPYLITTKASRIYNLSARKKEFAINQKIYTQHLISCKVLEWGRPDYVSLSLALCQEPDNLLDIHVPMPSIQIDFGVCTVPQYGQMNDDDVAFFVEWMELNKLFGVGEINIYNSTLKLSPLSQKAFEYYKEEGTLLIQQHQTPVERYPAHKEYEVAQLGLRSSVNDCLLRNRNRYKYIIILDRDEVIVPRTRSTYTELLRVEMEKKPILELERVPAISVYNAFFYRDFAEDASLTTNLVSMKYRTHKLPDNPFANVNFIPAKSFINPQRCLAAWNHHCLLPWYGKQFLKPEVALVHHYRSSCSGAPTTHDTKALQQTRCKHLLNNTVSDNHILNFRNRLETVVANKLKAISSTSH